MRGGQRFGVSEVAKEPPDFTLMPICCIWSAGYGKKPLANTAPKASPAEEPQVVIRMVDVGARVAARKAELGLPDLPRNAGQNRTASKRALLKAIEDLGGKW